MKITDVKIKKIEGESRVKAVAAVTFDDCFAVHGINVIYGQKVLYLDNTWNYFTVEYRSKKLHDLDKKIYHYARDVIKLYTCSPLDIAYYETIHRTPWGKQCATEILTKSMSRQLDRTHQLCAAIPFM